LTQDYLPNSRNGIATVCDRVVLIFERTYETGLSSTFFWREQNTQFVYTRYFIAWFHPSLRKTALADSWLYAAGKLMRLECTCMSVQECPADPINIEGTGILNQIGVWNFCTDQLLVPGSCQSESRAKWIGPKLVVPQIPDLLPEREVSCTRDNQTHLEDVWNAWSERKEEPAVSTSMITVHLTRLE
jgi:hypothetical protein